MKVTSFNADFEPKFDFLKRLPHVASNKSPLQESGILFRGPVCECSRSASLDGASEGKECVYFSSCASCGLTTLCFMSLKEFESGEEPEAAWV